MNQGLCPSCGATVNLPAEHTEVTCAYCSTLVKGPEAEAQFNEIRNSKFAGTLLIADTSREGGSFEEAITFYNKIIEQEPTFAEAWLNKGICMLQTSKIGDIKTAEAMSSWKAAIKFAKHPDAMKKRVAKEIGAAVTIFYPVLESHYKQFSTLDNAYAEFVGSFLKLDGALALAVELWPKNPDLCTTGIALCDAVLAAPVDAGAANAGSALMNKDWKGAIASAVSGFGAASAVRQPVERLKVKYQRALSAIDPNYKAPELPPEPPSPTADPKAWKVAVIESVRKLKPPGDVLLYPVSADDGVYEKAMLDLLGFLSPEETRDDVILYENNFVTVNSECIIVTSRILGWGKRGQPKKGFFSPSIEEKKVIIPREGLLEVTYAKPGIFDTKEPRPVVHYRNPFGVKTSVVLPTAYFKMHQQAIGGFPRHERAEAMVTFLMNWAGCR